MRLTSLTHHRPSGKPQADFARGQFFLAVESYRLARPSLKVPASLKEWPDAVCAAAVRAVIQDLWATPDADHFYESTAALVAHGAPMVQAGPWRLQMGPFHLTVMAGGADPEREHAQLEPVNPEVAGATLELTPEPGDAPLSSNPDVARTQAYAQWERQPDAERPPAVPLYQTLTEAQFAGLVRNVQDTIQALVSSPAAAFVLAGAALAAEALMARLHAEESEAMFNDVQQADGSRAAMSVLMFREKPAPVRKPAGP